MLGQQSNTGNYYFFNIIPKGYIPQSYLSTKLSERESITKLKLKVLT